MNWPSARSIRASPPCRMVKRLPDMRAAGSNSICPSASPNSKCSRAAKAGGGNSVCFSTMLALSSVPSGTSASSMFGSASSRWRTAASSAPARCSNALIASRSAVASASGPAASRSSRRACPISFDSAFRRAWPACASASAARRSASSASASALTGGNPRRAKAASNPAGSARQRPNIVHQASTGFVSTSPAVKIEIS